MQPTCPIHNKPLKIGKYGLYCNQPLTRSADGKQVLEWCRYKPDQEEIEKNANLGKVPTTATEHQLIREPVNEDEKARGMVRNTVAKAFIEKMTGEPKLSQHLIELMEPWVDYIMTGKNPFDETLSDEELAEIDKEVNF